RLPDGSPADIVVDGGRIARVGPGSAEGVAERIDCSGRMVLPAFIDGHVHLDKVLIRDELREHDGTLSGAIGAIHERKGRYTADDVCARAVSVIEESVRLGATRLRSHVDVDTIGGLTPLQGVMAAARECADIAEVRTIAFPQEGLLRDPGAYSLMEAALEAGADVVGGMPHWELDESAQREHVRLCFELAERFDRDLDMHVDETDDGGVRTLEMVADEALARGFVGRVCAGHVCSLAAADHDYADLVIEKCRRAEISIASNPVTNLVLQGRGDRGLIRRGTTRIAELRAAGVNVLFGQDCVKDGFYPFGRGSMLEVALISAHAAHLTTKSDLAYALRAITDAPAQAMRLTDYGLVAGARADMQLLPVPTWDEALRLQPLPEKVWNRGRLVAENSVRSELHRAGT
ncbi:MAG TPA: amidohydrolase family protein, partial [Candidatus Dormibacteraeota bacterium]|nr:amidohydrolase family protein [Candidatus Dormibacteraeota bacterium]